MCKLKINIPENKERNYTIHIKPGLLDEIGEDLKKHPLGNRYVIITDLNVKPLFGEKLLKSIQKQGLEVDLLAFHAGEASKRIETYETLLEEVYKLGLDRKSAVIALGGGVTGDLAGFVAATYMRGINYIQVPTTLLAMVDSSIGGKTGVDLNFGKNMCGVFHQPTKVYIDLNTLKPLIKRDLLSGLAELIKHAFILDRSLFNYLDKHVRQIFHLEMVVIEEIIKRSLEIKAEIVQEDERESDKRRLLNFGHTIGHAVETASGFGTLTHGEAVSIGMAYESKLSHKLGLLKEKDLHAVIELLNHFELPTELPENLNSQELLEIMKKDKKAVNGDIIMVLLEKIGGAVIEKVPDKTIMAVLES